MKRSLALVMLFGAWLVSVNALAADAGLPSGFTQQTATVNGVNISYKVGGKGPVVVLLHGFAQTSHMWLPLMPALAKTHTVIAPDLRGIGDSQRPATVNPSSAAVWQTSLTTRS